MKAMILNPGHGLICSSYLIFQRNRPLRGIEHATAFVLDWLKEAVMTAPEV